MKQSFNFTRAFLLLKATVIANKRVVIISLAILAIMFLISIINTISTNNTESLAILIELALIIAVVIPMVLIFRFHRKQEYVITTYMVPASIKDKYFAALFMSVLAFIVVSLLYITIASLCWSITLYTQSEYTILIDPLITSLSVSPSFTMLILFFNLHVTPSKYLNFWFGIVLTLLIIIYTAIIHLASGLDIDDIILGTTPLLLIAIYFLFKQIQLKNNLL